MLQTTPTESAILAVVNAAFVGLFVYQENRWSRSAEVTGAVCFCWVGRSRGVDSRGELVMAGKRTRAAKDATCTRTVNRRGF